MDRVYGAYRGFREPAMFADPNDQRSRGRYSQWGDFANRQIRYKLLWAFYEQNAFRDVQGWPAQYRSTYGLYDGVRDLFGVAHQLGEFWPSHLQGGMLDPKMGDGKETPSALPIEMDSENPAVREGLAELIKRSNWQINKDVMSRFGSTVGDVFQEIVDDEEAETIRVNVMPAGRVKWVDLSSEGNIEAYELEYYRPDPRQAPALETKDAPRAPEVKYNEIVTPVPSGGGIRFRTYLNGALWVWPGNPGSDFIITDLPFAPLVKIQHKNIGMVWGQSESFAALSGMREVSDLSSCLTDWARKALNAPHMLTGMKDPALDPAAIARAARAPLTPAQQRASYAGEFGGNGFGYWGGNGQASAEATTRNKQNYFYASDPQSRAHSLVHNIPVDGIGMQVDRLRGKLKEDYPELSFERIRTSGQASAEAIREARKPAEAKILARRVEYDAGTARAFKMALTLGGLRGYQHYQGFDAGSYDDGDLDFRIGERPAFAPDPAEQIAERLARYTAMKAATDIGMPLTFAMREAGYNDADIAEVERGQKKEQQSQVELIRKRMDMANAEKMPGMGQ
jgi:hypothetical protein